MMKRTLLSFILAIGMTANIWADTVIEGIKYALNDDFTATVTGLDDPSFTGTVTIPETIKYYGNTYQVVQIGDKAFFEYKFKSVVIPNSVTSIGNGAFSGCRGLTSVTINSNEIMSKSYSSSSNLSTIFGNQVQTYIIGDSVTSIGDGAFSGCSGLTSVTINSNAIMSETYSYSSNFSTIFGNQVQTYIIGDSVTSIGSYAFRGCTGLTSVTIPNSVTRIGYAAFYQCTGLTSIDIPNSVTNIERYVFLGCTGLTSIDIPNSVTSIGERAFEGCTGLTSVTIPNSVTSIGSYAFFGCSGLTSVTINSNAIMSKTYSHSSNLSTIFGNQVQTYIIGDSVTSIGRWAFLNCSGLTSVTIPNSVTSIGFGAFSGCTGLTSIDIPNSVTSIGGSAFSGCTGLTSIDIPNSVTNIENYVFLGCTGLTSIDIPNSVTSIGERAFEGCTGLTSVTIGNSVTSIGESAFNGCTGLTAINVDENNTTYSSIDGVVFNKSKTELVQYPGGKQGAYTILNSVTSIGERAFEGCTGLTSVTIPNSVTSIGRWAFNGCTGLTEINVDENNSTYSSIDGVVFNKSQTELVCYPGGKQGAYTIPNSVTSIGSYAFYGCSGLTSVTIGNSVTSIGEDAFFNCTGLTSVTIPNSVTSIGGFVFYGCTGLTSVDIPNSVTSIGEMAFYGCTSLTDIYCHIEEPLTITYYVFYYVPKTTCTLHVPVGSKEKYEVADVWKEFNIVEDLPTGIVSIDNSQFTIDNDVWYTLNGVRLNGKPTKAGVYIVNGKKVVIK